MRRGLSTLLAVLGCVGVAAGSHDVLRGVAGVRGRRTRSIDASVDSELRFFAAWYIVAGVNMLRAARAPEREKAAVELISAGWLAAVVGRMLSRRSTGQPHPLYTALTGAELAIATVLVPWQRRVARDADAAATIPRVTS